MTLASPGKEKEHSTTELEPATESVTGPKPISTMKDVKKLRSSDWHQVARVSLQSAHKYRSIYELFIDPGDRRSRAILRFETASRQWGETDAATYHRSGLLRDIHEK